MTVTAGERAAAASRPAWRWPASAPDVLLAAVLTVFGQLDVRFDIDLSTPYGSPWAVALCTAVATGALAWRRRAPLATALVVAVALAGPELFTLLTITLWGHFLPALIAGYSVAR